MKTKRPLQGVNLGGWLVLEKWLTPSLFAGTDAVDEYTFSQTADAPAKLAEHRATFITAKDFKWLAEHGVQAVRLPIGYWLFGDSKPYHAADDYVELAFKWAQRYGLKILLDVHGAPGSQNGWDHSGREGARQWADSAANQLQTLEFIEKLCVRWGNQPALLGISVLNEPHQLTPPDTLMRFYDQAYQIIRQYCPEEIWVVISDGFHPRAWTWRLPAAHYPGLYLDHHHYQMFSWLDKLLPAKWQLKRLRLTLPLGIKSMATHHPLIIGEWSLSLRAEKLAKLPQPEQQALIKRFARWQNRAFRPAKATFFWTYKTENSQLWDYRRCLKDYLS